MSALAVEQLLSRFAEDERDRLFPLLRDGPKACERLLGKRKDASTLFRWSESGKRGIRLQTIEDASTRYCTMRWLVEFFVELAAKRERERSRTRRKRPVRRTRTSRRSAVHVNRGGQHDGS